MKNTPADIKRELNKILYEKIDRYQSAIEHLEAFRKINSILISKYGKPYSKSIFWNSRPIEIEFDNYISAFEAGDLRYEWEWETTMFSISHEISCSDGEVYHDIFVSMPLLKYKP